MNPNPVGDLLGRVFLKLGRQLTHEIAELAAPRPEPAIRDMCKAHNTRWCYHCWPKEKP